MTTSPQHPWERAERLDAGRMTDAVHAGTGVRLVVEGPCPGGEVGAAYVRWPDGHRSVLKWRPDTRLEALRAGPLAVCEALRDQGCPCPSTELALQVGGGVVLVQELLPGTPPESLDHHGLDQALALNESQAGLLAGRADIPSVHLYLLDDGPGYCLHEPLRLHSPRSAALERRVRSVGAGHPPRLAGDDAVHQDFHHGNLLAVDGTVTGVIDWDGAGRGDRRFDLVTLRFGLHAREQAPGVVGRLDDILDALPDDVLRPCWAHMSLRMTDWAIRHFAPGDVEHWLDLAERRL
ncbi:aminoglycoside phosphotransferase family protein [Streptomyces sp. NBC_00053]|uniref:phosphotransferase n=1 Tax=unclassified Streptomyces TaxID=2593676 RepID=UPI000F5B9253|nr:MULTISPECIES: aminoglycoside phosphotransferase family protein [unclassified Streptomyces]WSG48908.1 aminoglycoside phosphotransferase family protein [Streptomyces sp. NBC_01732]WSW99558.1 aminoglycoside phosphotransferase family protein [Streptomyces sp. NBC_00987]MCX5158030.1 aminoglycoside phosphotransferase family protein [Streptomyces sp. NBC_00305]MCX5216553.1 aminoglycoside phosphotransferase family protein [Streptomyces sp. NBC_00264]MCX5498460.1 aminoglycoside phosphotransferase fa